MEMGAGKEGKEVVEVWALWKLSHRAPGSRCGIRGIVGGEPGLLLESLPRNYLLCHSTTSTPSFENLFRMANDFYPERKNNQSLA